MNEVQRAILQEVAEGRLSPEEAAVLLDQAEKAEQEQGSEHDEPSEETGAATGERPRDHTTPPPAGTDTRITRGRGVGTPRPPGIGGCPPRGPAGCGRRPPPAAGWCGRGGARRSRRRSPRMARRAPTPVPVRPSLPGPGARRPPRDSAVPRPPLARSLVAPRS